MRPAKRNRSERKPTRIKNVVIAAPAPPSRKMPRRGCKEGISYVEMDDATEKAIEEMDEFDKFMKSNHF